MRISINNTKNNIQKNNRKKTLIKKAAAILLAASLVASLTVTALADGSAPPDMPGGVFGDFGSGEMGTPPDGAPGGSGSSSGVDSYDAVYEYTEDTTISGETITSTGSDENAILISGGEVLIEDSEISRTSTDSTGGDNSSFYGVGAAVLATDGTAYVTGSDITTDAAGGAGVFAYGDGVVYVADTTISTSQNTSGGIHAAGGGTLYAWNVTATTQGGSSAAIRSDRGGGTMVVDGGTYTSNGTGSPAVYCTADISIANAVLTATNSEAICIEGLNSLALYDCDLTGSMPEDSQNDCTWTVIVYQSMSGDSEVGCGTFQMQGGSLTSTNGGLFYTTNTESNFYISNVDITASDDCEFFLKCTGNANQRGWGSTGSNGADCVFTAADQEAVGDIIWDSISTLEFYLTDGSTLKGAFVDDESCAGAGGSGYANLYIDEDSTWIVTADSELSALYNAGTITDADGKTVTIRDTSGNILVQGESSVTITVTTYSESADISGMVIAASWDDVSIERPDVLGTAQADIAEKTSEETENADTTEESSQETRDGDESQAENADGEDQPEAVQSEVTEAAVEIAEQENVSDFPIGWVAGIAGGIIVIGAAVLIVIKKKKK